jgi:hypothetical protein
MTNTPYGKREAPFSLRLTFEERAELEAQAGGMPLAAYIKSLLFADDAPKYRERRRAAAADEKLLAEVLACLGSSYIATRLGELAKAANSGSLYCDQDTKADIKRACDDVHAMRVSLMRALGIQADDGTRSKESTSQSFARAASRNSIFPNPNRRFDP